MGRIKNYISRHSLGILAITDGIVGPIAGASVIYDGLELWKYNPSGGALTVMCGVGLALSTIGVSHLLYSIDKKQSKLLSNNQKSILNSFP